MKNKNKFPTQDRFPESKTIALNNKCEKPECEETVAISLKSDKSLHFSMPVHGSVGFTLDVENSDPSLIDIASTLKYEYPDRAQMPGGDAAVKNYYLTPLAEGQSTVTFTKGFRGGKVQVFVFHINVNK